MSSVRSPLPLDRELDVVLEWTTDDGTRAKLVGKAYGGEVDVEVDFSPIDDLALIKEHEKTTLTLNMKREFRIEQRRPAEKVGIAPVAMEAIEAKREELLAEVDWHREQLEGIQAKLRELEIYESY